MFLGAVEPVLRRFAVEVHQAGVQGCVDIAARNARTGVTVEFVRCPIGGLDGVLIAAEAVAEGDFSSPLPAHGGILGVHDLVGLDAALEAGPKFVAMIASHHQGQHRSIPLATVAVSATQAAGSLLILVYRAAINSARRTAVAGGIRGLEAGHVAGLIAGIGQGRRDRAGRLLTGHGQAHRRRIRRHWRYSRHCRTRRLRLLRVVGRGGKTGIAGYRARRGRICLVGRRRHEGVVSCRGRYRLQTQHIRRAHTGRTEPKRWLWHKPPKTQRRKPARVSYDTPFQNKVSIPHHS